MKTTANYGLKKPEGNDTVIIDDLNYNADVVDKKIKAVETNITDLKKHVDNGKSSLYSAIVGKKITPRSKDFSDLKSAIDGIKLGQGNAQANDVLQGKTFTNDSGVMQSGTISNMGNKIITPSKDMQTLGNGFYNNITIKGVTEPWIYANFPKITKKYQVIKGCIENINKEKRTIEIQNPINLTRSIFFCEFYFRQKSMWKLGICISDPSMPYNDLLHEEAMGDIRQQGDKYPRYLYCKSELDAYNEEFVFNLREEYRYTTEGKMTVYKDKIITESFLDSPIHFELHVYEI